MMIHIEESNSIKPIIRVILDPDEKVPKDSEEIRVLILAAARAIPRDMDKIKVIRLENPHAG